MVYSDPYWDHPTNTCTTCQKCSGFMRKEVSGDLEWLAICADERMTQPHDGLVQLAGTCVHHEKATSQ